MFAVRFSNWTLSGTIEKIMVGHDIRKHYACSLAASRTQTHVNAHMRKLIVAPIQAMTGQAPRTPVLLVK